ncbi:MAG TPA: phosphomannomutase/phosphoglucomutase, partial [Amycolatopsis sp.]
MPDLSGIVKAYDIRGVVGEQLDAALVRDFGAAFALLIKPEAPAVVIGHDMRDSSPELSAAFADGVTSQGIDVVSIGLASTDELYFASGSLNLPGAMFTASHNPAKYNGIKMCRAGAAPVGQDTGLAEIRDSVEQGVPSFEGKRGTVTEQDVLHDYAAYLRNLVDLSGSRPLKIVVDAGNGMGGHTVPTVFDGLPIEIVPMYFELDGNFPNHEANPLDPANIVDLQAKVREVGADAGVAFDGDADRCFVVDERGEPVSPSAITALVAVRELVKEPGGTVIHNLITSKGVPEIVAEHGGKPVRTRVGHSFIKAEMARTGAIFGGEHSAHYYFKDFWNADTGMLAALHVLAALGGQGGPLSGLVAQYDRYVGSGEINSTVDDQQARLAAIRTAYENQTDLTLDELDGLT